MLFSIMLPRGLPYKKTTLGSIIEAASEINSYYVRELAKEIQMKGFKSLSKLTVN